MADKIIIKEIAVSCTIGIYPEEKQTPQEILIDIEATTDIKKAAKSDEIEDALNYEELEAKAIDLCKSKHHNLIERLVEEIAASCLENRQISEILVRIKKPKALKNSKYSAVEIIRQR